MVFRGFLALDSFRADSYWVSSKTELTAKTTNNEAEIGRAHV